MEGNGTGRLRGEDRVGEVGAVENESTRGVVDGDDGEDGAEVGTVLAGVGGCVRRVGMDCNARGGISSVVAGLTSRPPSPFPESCRNGLGPRNVISRSFSTSTAAVVVGGRPVSSADFSSARSRSSSSRSATSTSSAFGSVTSIAPKSSVSLPSGPILT
jgi:hypothetical protein